MKNGETIVIGKVSNGFVVDSYDNVPRSFVDVFSGSKSKSLNTGTLVFNNCGDMFVWIKEHFEVEESDK